MKRELGVGRCGLACCLCSEHERCRGCSDKGFSNHVTCENRKCSQQKGLEGCYACTDSTCRKGLLSQSKPLGFCEYIRHYGKEQLLDRLEMNMKAGAVYHRHNIFGDYDDFETAQEVIGFVDALAVPFEFKNTQDLTDGEIRLCLVRTAEADLKRRLVPAYFFDICLTDGTRVGTCDLRVAHSARLYIGGNIGYTVFLPYRGHHYARKACRLLFKLAARHALSYVYITCAPENLPSRRTLEGLGGNMV